MPPKAKSQWDFSGELFPTQELRRVLTVSEITGNVRRLIEERVGTVWVTGEISNLRAQSSGHIYFSLKDANAQLACVCFRDDARGSRQFLQDGRKVVLQGDATVYEARGQYQLIVTSVELEGLGALQVAFEKLKERLAAEGLFAPERKRPIPALVQRLGLVTSPTGAALSDVLHVIERRHPGLEIFFAPCRVQGQEAASEIAGSIHLLNEWAATGNKLDAILITRGGGSLEDLWAFNEEIVARAIFESRVPVVSAVGHEIDFTIGDFVADLRAATPSAAAELLTEGMMRKCEWLAQSITQMFTLVRERIEAGQEQSEWLISRLARAHPRRQMNQYQQQLDDWQRALSRSAVQNFRQHQLAARSFVQRLVRLKPAKLFTLRRQTLAERARRLREDARRALETKRRQFRELETRLRLLSPDHVLERGYSITRDVETGAVIRDARNITAGRKVKTRVQNGEFISVVERPARSK
jgi:exodeoxyribonuclease VII large subunit